MVPIYVVGQLRTKKFFAPALIVILIYAYTYRSIFYVRLIGLLATGHKDNR